MNFDVYRGKLKDGETVAIKLYRERLMNDGKGTRFVEVITHPLPAIILLTLPSIVEDHATSPIVVIV
jgi:hypothetical protein